ncbi:MAG: bifunctional 4-hydroxy-2-oxoglutarate aldolase/2-dehydro-3-deoxy-phosphogluconate aldolase [Burkholderiales bacterium]|jgi:2-dehydro-3-deoxyphosphogluconate aldolase/(4S)-4-hydroxy-2-oxoglutarate aldolase
MTLLELFDPSPAARHEPPAPVIPVIVLDDARHAVPLARACADGGVDVLEVTLRTPAGLESLRRIAAEVPSAWVGAGTVTTVADVVRVAAAGARFAVSPGFDPAIVAAARDHGLPLMPGVMTPTEVMAALAQGLSLLKLFPAAVAGGVAMLKALAGPFPGVRFCPTGGIDARSAPDYLALPNVVAVGGSWLTPASAIARGDWAAITTLARAAAALRRGPAMGRAS